MTPVYQTQNGHGIGNCFAACVASLLDKRIEDVEIDLASCGNCLRTLMTKVEQKANCKIYFVSHEAILDGVVKPTERYCFVEVCTCVFNKNPHDSRSTWHVVVCEIFDHGKISLVFNPDQRDQRQKSLDQFPAINKVFFVKANAQT
jgi:hypothetical protein